jgi:hypothetical protein
MPCTPSIVPLRPSLTLNVRCKAEAAIAHSKLCQLRREALRRRLRTRQPAVAQPVWPLTLQLIWVGHVPSIS